MQRFKGDSFYTRHSTFTILCQHRAIIECSTHTDTHAHTHITTWLTLVSVQIKFSTLALYLNWATVILCLETSGDIIRVMSLVLMERKYK